MTECIGNQSPLEGDLQTVSPRQRVFTSWESTCSFVRNIQAKRVYIETAYHAGNFVWIVQWTGSEGQDL